MTPPRSPFSEITKREEHILPMRKQAAQQLLSWSWSHRQYVVKQRVNIGFDASQSPLSGIVLALDRKVHSKDHLGTEISRIKRPKSPNWYTQASP